jgi:glycosyltransferase involved in cell wall biosynthesis
MASYVISAAFYMPFILKRHQLKGAIIFFSVPCGPLGLWGNLLFGLPYVISLRGGDVPGTEPSLDMVHKTIAPLRSWVYRRSKAVVANSMGLKQLSEKADVHPVDVIPNGVDTAFFTPGKKRDGSDRPIRFLFAGRFREQKNLFFLLEQMNQVAKENHHPFHLHLIGNGPQEDALKRYARVLDIKHRIFWHDWSAKETLRDHYHVADCVINPSHYEGMPNVVLESMACALPIIASHVAGNDAVVKDQETGLLFEPGNGEQFRRSIKRIMEDRQLGRNMGEHGRQWVVENFSWEHSARAYLDLFSDDLKPTCSSVGQ